MNWSAQSRLNLDHVERELKSELVATFVYFHEEPAENLVKLFDKDSHLAAIMQKSHCTQSNNLCFYVGITLNFFGLRDADLFQDIGIMSSKGEILKLFF